MWTIYDELIESVPKNYRIKAVHQTERWTLVESDSGIGTAMNFTNELSSPLTKYRGVAVQEVAALIKSWDEEEASIGLAAINSFFNQTQTVTNHFSTYRMTNQDAFEELPQSIQEQTVGMIGHFPYVDRHPEIKNRLTIFEQKPKAGDLPASAAEFLLPDMDIVYITASTIINKTLPRLLELSQNARTVLVGASCPLSRTLFRHKIDILAGTCYEISMTELLNQKENRLPLTKCGQSIKIEMRK